MRMGRGRRREDLGEKSLFYVQFNIKTNLTWLQPISYAKCLKKIIRFANTQCKKHSDANSNVRGG